MLIPCGPVGYVAAALLAACTLLSAAPASSQQVVANESTDVKALDLHTLRAIFGMRLTEWPNGSRVVVFVMDPDSQIHTNFAKRRLRLFPYQLTQAWDRLVFSGTGQAPVEVRTPTEMRRRLLATPGAIGYLPTNLSTGDLLIVEITE